MTLIQVFSRSLLPAAGHLSALVLGSSTCQAPSLLQLAGDSSSKNRCCTWPVTCQFSSCSNEGRTAAGADIISSNTCKRGSSSSVCSSEPSSPSSTTSQLQQARYRALSPNGHLQPQHQRRPALTQQTVSWAHTPQRHGGVLTARAGTLIPCYSTRMQCQAAAAPAAAGPGVAVPVLQLCSLLLPRGPLLQGVRGWSSSTVDRWRPDGTADRWQPDGTVDRWRSGGTNTPQPGKPRVLLGQLCAQAESLQELQQLLHQHAEHINGIAVTAAFARAGKLCQCDDALARSASAVELLQHLDQLLPAVRAQLGPRELSSSIWSCAYTQHTAVVAQLLPDFMLPGNLSVANSHSVGSVLWTLATLEQQVPQRQLQQLADALVRQTHTADPQAISNSIWALGKLGYQAPHQQLSAPLAAFTSEDMLDRATTQAISNLLSGMAYMGQQLPAAQLQVLLAAFVCKCSGANAQDIANLLWAVSEMRQQVQDEQRGQLQAEFVQQLELLLAAFVQQLHRAMPQVISNTLLACARFSYYPVQLLAALQRQEHMQRFLAGASPQALANTAWACGILGHHSELLLGGLLRQAAKLLQLDSSSFVCQMFCNTCWAVAVLDLRQYVPAVLQLAEAASRVWRSAAPEELRQLYQVHLWLLDLAAAGGGKGPGLLQVLSQQQLDECRKLWQDQVAAATPSPIQRQVFKALQRLPGWQVPPKQEKLTDDGNFSIDIVAVTAAGVKLAVEVDGPSHLVSPGNRVNGRTQYRDRALKARGYTVVSIPWREWEQQNGVQQQKQYLQDKLKGAHPSAT